MALRVACPRCDGASLTTFWLRAWIEATCHVRTKIRCVAVAVAPGLIFDVGGLGHEFSRVRYGQIRKAVGRFFLDSTGTSRAFFVIPSDTHACARADSLGHHVADLVRDLTASVRSAISPM